jgi:signal transduction histidine kinase
MHIIGIYLIFAAVVVRAAVVLVVEPEFPIIMGLLASYGLLLCGETWSRRRKRSRNLQSQTFQLAYLVLQSVLVIGILILSSYEDFLALLFIPLSMDAVSFFGRRAGYRIIAIFSVAVILTFLFSDEGQLFGLAMGTLYSGICFLFGGYAHQVQKASALHSQNKKMLSELQTAHGQLQEYANQKEHLAIEQERNRLAHELHDSVTQTVFSMNLAAQSAHLLLEREPQRAAGQLLRIEELAAGAQGEIQALVSQLRPLSIAEEDLPASLRRLTAEQKVQSGLQVSLKIDHERALPRKVATNLYLIIHEALINVARHSGTCEATISLDLARDGSHLEIEDHGRGFQPETVLKQPGHLGLAGIQERAHEIGWSLAVLSEPGQGTRIRLTEDPPGALE